jgi:hypothetical protein
MVSRGVNCFPASNIAARAVALAGTGHQNNLIVVLLLHST